MRRSEGLTVLSRRDVCGAFASCVGLALISSCTDGDVPGVQTGGLNGPDGTETGSGGHPDAGVPPHDAPMVDSVSMGTCPSSGATDVGPPSSFTMNNPVYKSSGNFFVVRDSAGLYALTAKCTHEGATCVVDTGEFFCPRHGATFSFNGAVLGGPVVTGLVHYAMCRMPNGNVAVITSQHVSNSQRLMA
jgi:nitrite reductase/ring-hydroxylating ferredoxin subunit